LTGAAIPTPITIVLDDEVRDELSALAKARGLGLADLLCDLAAGTAREERRVRIRAASAGMGAIVPTSAEAHSFYDDWGTPLADTG
jgi:hypothetical protein